MALKAKTEMLDFHLSPLLKAGGLATQIRHSLSDLIRDTHGETIVKLRAFVAGAGDARQVQAEVVKLFGEHKLPLPVLTILQVGALGDDEAKVCIEAVVETRRVNNPQGLAFFAGQSGDSLAGAVAKLKASAQAASVWGADMLSVTCFASRLNGPDSARPDLEADFPHANINVVQAQRDPLSDAGSCEGIGRLSKALPATSPVVLAKSERAALVGARELVITGLQLSFGSFLDDAHEALLRLRHSAAALDQVETPVQIDVFSIDPSGGSALRKNAADVPPSTFSVQTIEGLPSVDATAGIEAILAPGVAQAASE